MRCILLPYHACAAILGHCPLVYKAACLSWGNQLNLLYQGSHR